MTLLVVIETAEQRKKKEDGKIKKSRSKHSHESMALEKTEDGEHYKKKHKQTSKEDIRAKLTSRSLQNENIALHLTRGFS